jgi:DNA-binding CsgD family transcriptional regulator
VEEYRESDPLARHSLSPVELQELLRVEGLSRPFLAFRDSSSVLHFFQLTGGEHTLGRGAEMGLSLPWDGEISSLHAELRCLGGEWALVDDGLSTNGTYINGQRLHGRARLRNGDLIHVGRTTIAYGTPSSLRAREATVATGQRPREQPLTDTQQRVLLALCRPYRDRAEFATPATNQQIADEVFLSVDAVKMHLRTLFAKFGLAELPQNQKRTRLAEHALQFGLVSRRDLT